MMARLRLCAVTVVSALALGVLVSAQRADQNASVDLVEIDAVVIDSHGQPFRGLKQTDFQIREDDKPVDIKTFSESAGVSRDPDSGRRVIILLDDAAVPPVGRQTIQIMARYFVDVASPYDEVSVVRLNNRSDEPYGDHRVAESRILEYYPNTTPFADWDTPQWMLNRVAQISRQMDQDDHRRKVIVCIGAPVVCNIPEPAKIAPHRMWPAWVTALTATAEANVAVYAFIPGEAKLRGGGIVDYTGGEVLATTYDVSKGADRIMRDASHYYMLGYWPTGEPREVHTIDVKVNAKGARVHARKRRGDPAVPPSP